jgi:probable blue pigment (indigoidine) exporter
MPAYRHAHSVAQLVAAAACWGVGTVITKQVLTDVRPLTLLPVQLLASCTFLTVVAVATRSRVTWSPAMRRLTALGVLNPGLAYAVSLIGLTLITASLSVLLWATEPLLILLLAVAVLREHVPKRVAAAMVLALAGVVLVVYSPGPSGSPTGVALTVAAVAACAVYTVLARRWLLDDASLTVALTQQAAALGFAVLLATAVQVLGGEAWNLSALSAPDWGAAAASGVLYYGLAYWLYLTGLRQVSASVAGSFITLVPVFGVAAGYLVGERLTARQWVGAMVVVIAMAVMASRQHDARPLRPRGPRRQRHHR